MKPKIIGIVTIVLIISAISIIFWPSPIKPPPDLAHFFEGRPLYHKVPGVEVDRVPVAEEHIGFGTPESIDPLDECFGLNAKGQFYENGGPHQMIGCCLEDNPPGALTVILTDEGINDASIRIQTSQDLRKNPMVTINAGPAQQCLFEFAQRDHVFFRFKISCDHNIQIIAECDMDISSDHFFK